MISTLQSRPMFRSSWPMEDSQMSVFRRFPSFCFVWAFLTYDLSLTYFSFHFCVFLWDFFLSALSWSFWWAGLLREEKVWSWRVGMWGVLGRDEGGEAWLAWLNETGFQLQKETRVLYEFRTKKERRTSQGRGTKMYSYVVIEIWDGETGAGGLNGERRGLLVLGGEGEKEHEVRWEDLWGVGGLEGGHDQILLFEKSFNFTSNLYGIAL